MANNQTFTLNIKALFDASDVKAKVGDIQSTLSKLKLPDKLATDLNKSFTNVNKALDDFTSKTEKGIKTKTDATGITRSFDAVTKELTNLDNLLIKVKSQLGDGVDLTKIIKIPDDTKNRIADLQKEIDDLQKKISEINVSKLKTLEDALSKVKTKGSAEHGQLALDLFKQGDIDGAIAELDKFTEKLKTFKQTANVTESITALEQMKAAMVAARNESADAYADITSKTQEQAQIAGNAVAEVTNKLNDQTSAFHETSTAASGLTGKINDLTSSQAQFVREVDQVKSRIQYFFGLANSINLVKRAIRGAVDTVKELDAAMTETAVVTDHTVSDMWAKLPEYTKRANELGVSTLAAYKSATLYYQQGLNDEQAAALSVETLKMARIAGLEAAEATDRMTNALRGFNMELNEVSAQKVDDVYSQLAAMSASNVDEISTAMTKVASLAHNANMEFETTAAFLAQIIETTRESAETAGTALKTVVARFSEVKKLYDMDELKGKDEEGQAIDVNRVASALRTAGIDLNKYFLGEVGLDDIFMELASKWDSLTSVQQRYIATQAAGSRQQSRFIALMQDYARTQQLVSAAYNANGASARQFEKTQESLQSKLARLKNAWDAFLMGLANNAIIKGAVDLLTLLLNTVNNLTGAFGNGIGTILKWVAAVSGFVGLRSAFGATGIATKAVGGLVGSTPIGNAIKFALGAVTKDKEGNFVPVENGARQSILFGDGGLFNRIGNKVRGFNSDALTNAQSYNAYKQMADEYMAINPGAANPYAQEMAYYSGTSKFALLGKKFYGTKVGSIARGGLAKLGVAGGEAAAVSGTAALAATIGTITVAAGAAAIAIKAMYDATPQGQLKIAQKYADAMSTAANNTQKQASELQKASRSIKEYDTALQKATTTSQRKQVIEDRNNYIQSLLEQNSKYAEYLTTTFENGQMVLTLDIDASALDAAIRGANFAQAGSDFAQAIVADRQANILKNKLSNVDFTNNRVYSTADELGYHTMSNAEKAQYVQYQRQLESYESQLNAYTQKAFSSLIPTGQVADDVANLMSEALAQGFDETKLPTGSGWWRSRSHWQNEYLERYGTEADSSMKTADIYRAIQQYDNTQEQSDKAQALTELLTGESKDAYTTWLEGITGQGNLENKNLLQLNTNSESSIFEFLGLDVNNVDELADQLTKLADALGMTTDEVREGIKKRAQAQKKEQQQTAFNTSVQMQQAGVSGKNIASYLTLEDIEQQQLFNDLFSSFDSSYLSDNLVSNLLDGIKQGNTELTDWLKNIDLSNPIQAFNKLSDAAANSNGVIKNTAQELLQAGNASNQFSKSAQLSYFATSGSLDDLSDSLSKFITENGKINSANIEELADANADLNGLLENNITSAAGLAAILTELEQGTINVWDLNDAIIAATAMMDDLDGMVAQTIADLNGFDPGYDENDVTSFIQKVLKNANENIEKGAVGNNQMRNYMEYIFGDFDKEFQTGKWGTDYGTAYQNWLDNNVQWLEANQDNMYSAWQNIAPSLQQQFGEIGKVYDDGTQIILEAGGRTTQQLIDAMVATGKVTEQQARMMIADFKNYSADFAHEMAENDLPGVIQEWLSSLPEIDGSRIYNETDLETLSHLLGVSVDKIRDKINELKDISTTYKEITWTNEKGERTKESITNALNQIDPDLLTKGFTTVTDGLAPKTLFGDAFDRDKIKAAYDELGISDLFESDFNKIAQSGDKFFTNFFGKPKEIAVGEGQTAGEAYADAYQQAVNEDLADKLASSLKTALTEEGLEVNITVSEDGLGQIQLLTEKEKKAEEARQNIDGKNVNVTASYEQVNGLSSALDSVISKLQTAQALAASGINANANLGGIFASGGIIGSYAGGSTNNHGHPGMALTGEEGPELVWNKDKGYAYLTGKNHPEIQYLHPGDRIFNAQETKKIIGSQAAGGVIPSFARGYGAANTATTKKSGGSGSGGSRGGADDKTPEEWKNDLDWLYNLMEDIAELERDQKAIEEQYEDALQDQSKTGRDLYNLLVKQLGNLYTQLDHQTFALQKREQEMHEFMDITNDKDQYLWYNWQDRTLEIDWDAIDRITDEEEYKHVKELVDEAEEIQDKMDDADDAIMDITNQIQELENIWRDTFTDFEKRVLDAVVKMYQTVIDNYSELNDTLNNSNQSILDSLQKEINLQRQIRDNTKTEEEISDDEARLAYLRRDTSGGNELAALQLQKELADKRESYEDSLVDQAISRLQDDNAAAQEQRERQIEIMQAQLDYQSENGEFNAYISELLSSAMGADGELLTNSDLVDLLKEQENWSAMSDVSKEVWDEELNSTFKEVAAFLLKQNAEENGTFYTALTKAVEGVSSAIGSYSQAMVKIGNQISSAASGGYGGGSSGGSGDSGSSGGGSNKTYKPAQTYSVGGNTYHSRAVQIGTGSVTLNLKKHAKGGLNTTTGLAWLDGTPQEPEYVLNARQTDAFLRLADVLPQMMGSGGGMTTTSFGSNYFNVSVNVDQISSDYDVDRMVDRIKDKLYDDASYRNVNTLSFLR